GGIGRQRGQRPPAAPVLERRPVRRVEPQRLRAGRPPVPRRLIRGRRGVGRRRLCVCCHPAGSDRPCSGCPRETPLPGLETAAAVCVRRASYAATLRVILMVSTIK